MPKKWNIYIFYCVNSSFTYIQQNMQNLKDEIVYRNG